jgi:signal transduction histidine kinase
VLALEATSEIARAVGGETQLDRVLELIAKRSRALIEATGVAILLIDGSDFVIAAIAGDIPRGIVGARVKYGGSVAGRVIASGLPQRVADLSSSLRFALGELGVEARSALFVPLVYRGSALGVIEAFDRDGGPEFLAEDERMLLAAAASAATAVATAQTVERDRLRRSLKAAEEERRRWARELHDETLQGLGGLRVLLSSARRTSDLETLRGAVGSAVEQLSAEIANLRALITELRPAALDELGLKPALDALVDRARTIADVEIHARIEIAAGTRLDPESETAVYRVVQESLTNAIRHAQARRVEIEVLATAGEIQLTVRDDGAGFDPLESTAGFGLTSMRERVSLVGGELDITSGSDGTRIRAKLPSEPSVRQTA